MINFANYLNGRENCEFLKILSLRILETAYRRLRIDTSGLGLPETGFEMSDGSCDKCIIESISNIRSVL